MTPAGEGVRTHTPGPWSYRPQPHDDWGVVRAGRYWICQAKDPRAIDDEVLAAHRSARTDPWEANARLIASAPCQHGAAAEIDRLSLVILSAVEADQPEQYDAVVAALLASRAALTAARGTDSPARAALGVVA